MRTIRFRGKDESGEWQYGNLVRYKEDDGEEVTCIVATERCEVSAELAFVPVDEKTVGEISDLLDKDGKEIYEDDVIECGSKRYVCEFIEGGFEFRDLSDGELILKAIVIHSHVIGNIHDNPELKLN